MKRFRKILYVLNGQLDTSAIAFKRALSLAENNSAELSLLRVLPHLSSMAFEGALGMSQAEIESRMLDETEQKLAQTLSMVVSKSTLSQKVVLGKNYLEAIRLVIREGYDLVIKVAENPGWLDRLFGSDDMHFLRKCPCPVWIMKDSDKLNYTKIMAAVDFDQNNQDFGEPELNCTIMELSSSLALAEFASLHVVNVYDALSAGFISLWVNKPELVEQQLQQDEYEYKKSALTSLLQWLKKKIGDETYAYLSPSTELIQGNPAQLLPELASKQEIDIVVMGSVGRSGISGLIIGNTAESVLSQLSCSVLVVKPAGFVSPVS